MQDDLADKNGIAVIVVDKYSTDIYESNNNSICKTLYSSDEFSSECAKFCGNAFKMASKPEKLLNINVMPVWIAVPFR